MPTRWQSTAKHLAPTSAESDAHPARDFEGEIARATQEAEALKLQMADGLGGWLDATAPWVAAFWERSIAEAVREEPDAVIALGDDARKAVKDDAATLIANTRPHIQRRLVDERPEDWPHLKPQTDPRDDAFRPQGSKGPFAANNAKGPAIHKSVPEAVEGRLNGVLGDVASLCSHHGFALTGFEHGDPYGHRGQWHPDSQHKPEWSEQMVAAMAAYGALHGSYVAALSERERLAAEAKHSQAANLWDEA